MASPPPGQGRQDQPVDPVADLDASTTLLLISDHGFQFVTVPCLGELLFDTERRPALDGLTPGRYSAATAGASRMTASSPI